MYKGQSIFWYNAPFRDLAVSAGGAAGEASFTLQIQSDADFECQYLMSNFTQTLLDVATDLADVVLEGYHYPHILLDITELDTGQRWFNEPVSIPNVCGTATNPFVLPQTKLLSKSSSLSVTVYNHYTLQAFPLGNITFFGRKLYT